MFLLGFHRNLTALALCKSIQSVIQWFQIHHRNTFATIQNSALYLSGARVSIFPALVPRLLLMFIGSLYCKLLVPNILKTMDPVLVIKSMALFNIDKIAIAGFAL